ncbi:DUF1552 domain-containing protein [Verrucomicrobia bacterium]|nr:DUF1552 domain-containing protein [Verrucomicrobiota bacterium]
MKKSWHISRRTLLRGIGASIALPTLEIMTPTTRAAAIRNTPPKRLVCIFQPNGVYPKAWDVAGKGSNFELSPILSPLAPVKDDIVVLSGIDNLGKGHVEMTGSFLTGVPIKKKRNGVSLDQQVANQIGGTTRFKSLELGTEPPRQGLAGSEPIAYANTVSWSSPTTRVSPEINPQVAFDRLFRAPNSPEVRQKAAQRRSVVDLVLEDAKALRRNASNLDQHKIDEYLASVRSVETRIEKTLNPPEPDWTPLSHPDIHRPEAGIPRDREQHLQLMADLLIFALQTDNTRVATLMTAHGFSRQNFSFLDGVSSDHHGMSHHKDKEDAIAEYTTVSRWYISQFSRMVQQMKTIDEGGSTLLENTILLYGSGMKDGNGHVKSNLPLLLAGQGGGTLETGRQVDCGKGVPISNLHLTLARKFGVETDNFNHSSTGDLDNLI